MYEFNDVHVEFARAYIYSPCYGMDDKGLEDDWLMYLMGADIL